MFRFRNPTAAVLTVLALAFIQIEQVSAQTGAIVTKGNLHLLAVGISQYEVPGNDLEWADQDAIDHAAFWASLQGQEFNRVFGRKPLLNRKATAENIRRAMMEILGQVQPGDTVVAPFSGHGAEPKDGEWRFCAADCSSGGFITGTELRGWASRLVKKGVQVILIVDACFAGAIADPLEGVIILASSQANEGSADGDPLALKGNGVFTQVLLEALRGKADANSDGIITVQEVVDYLTRNVPKLAGHHPKAAYTLSIPGTFRMCRVNGASTTAGQPSVGHATSPIKALAR